jgi:hypothetical protein
MSNDKMSNDKMLNDKMSNDKMSNDKMSNEKYRMTKCLKKLTLSSLFDPSLTIPAGLNDFPQVLAK